MRHAFLLICMASAVFAAPAARGQKFLDRSMNDWMNDLKQGAPEARRSAAFALGKLGEGAPEFVIDALTHSLRDKDAVVRDFAASSLGDVLTALGDQARPYWDKVGPVLQEALKDEAPRVRRSAAVALGAFGPKAVAARDDLIAATGDSAAIVRQNAAWALGKLGQEAGQESIEHLRDLLTDKEPLVRRDALHALGEIGNPIAHPAVAAMMQAAGAERDGVVRKAAVEALSKLVGKDDRADASALDPLLTDVDSETRYDAAFVLGMIGGSEAKEALPALREALKDEDPHFQELAAATIGGLGKDAAPAVEDLGKALTEAKEPVVRTNAAISLEHIGSASQKVIPQLLQALRYNDSASESQYNIVRPFAAEALSRIQSSERDPYPGVEAEVVAGVLPFIPSDPDPEVRHQCLWTLRNIQDLNKYKITPVLAGLLEETGPATTTLRYDAARILAGRLGDKAPDKTADVLLEMLTAESLVQFNGTNAKTRGVGGEGTAGTTQVNEDQGGDARWMAAEALGWLGRKAKRPDILKALEAAKTDKDEKLKEKATEALKAIQ